MKLIAKNAGVNGSVVIEKVCACLLAYIQNFGKSCFAYGRCNLLTFFLQVLSSDNQKYGYNAATGTYEDLMAAGIIDPTKASFWFGLRCF